MAALSGAYDLRQGDCLSVLSALPTASVDALITDPPYGSTNAVWDRVVDLPTWWNAVRRVIKPTAVCAVFAAQPFATDVINAWRAGFRYDLIWEKPNAVGFLDARRRPLRAHEHVLVFAGRFRGSVYNPQMTLGKAHTRGGAHRGTVLYGSMHDTPPYVSNEYYPRSVLKMAGTPRAGNLHPTQKPLSLVHWLVETYSQPGAVILDPFMGSGTTGVAAVQTGRRFIGVELDEHYFGVAQARIASARRAWTAGRTADAAPADLETTGVHNGLN